MASTDAAIRLAKAGFGVYGIDYIGHGKSSGLPGYIFSFDDLVNDCSDHFTNISGKSYTPFFSGSYQSFSTYIIMLIPCFSWFSSLILNSLMMVSYY